MDPCNEMGIVVNSEMMAMKTMTPAKSKDVMIRLVYNMQKYQEIKNERDFGMDSVWSYTGGFMGLFVGCCLLSLLDDGYDLIAHCLHANRISK